MNLAFDDTMIREAVQNGLEVAYFETLKQQHGICFDGVPELDGPLPEPKFWWPGRENELIAMDAPPQSALVSAPNAGIPSMFTTWVDPKLIAYLVAPMVSEKIAGSKQQGAWEDDQLIFGTGEATGETSAYGDYSYSGSADVNYNFPYRQNFRFQTFIQYGDLEIRRAGRAKRNIASDKQGSAALAIQKFFNYSNFFGIQNLLIYGLLNDPALPPPLTAQFPWINASSSTTANTMYQDIVRLWEYLQQNTQGVISQNAKLVLATSQTVVAAMKNVTSFNTNSVYTLLEQNFKNLRIEEAPEYSPPVNQSGNLIQLFAEDIDDTDTAECSFSVKMMAHRTIQDSSAIRQKRSAGTHGCIIKRPVLFAQMLV